MRSQNATVVIDVLNRSVITLVRTRSNLLREAAIQEVCILQVPSMIASVMFTVVLQPALNTSRL